MSQDNGPNRQREDRNGSPGSSLLLIGGLVVLTLLLVAVWLYPLLSHDLGAADLKRLVLASPHTPDGKLQDGATGWIDVLAKEGKKDVIRRYADLRYVT